MTGPEDFLNKLDELEAELANLNVQQKVVQPRTQEHLERLLGRARQVIEEFRTWQRSRSDEERLAAIVEQLREYTAIAHERLEHIEEFMHDGAGTTFPADPEVVAEGEWLKGMLAGPPSPANDPQLLKDAPIEEFPSGLGVLAEALFDQVQAGRAQQHPQQQQRQQKARKP